MTTALEWGEGSETRPGRSLPPGKTRYLLYRRLGGPQGRSGQVRKISLPPRFDPRTVQPLASRYTDYATRPYTSQGQLAKCVSERKIFRTKFVEFYIHGSVHRNSILIRSNKMQQYAGIYLLQYCPTCFGCPSHPSSGLHKNVTAASGTGHITYLDNNLPPAWPN